MEFLNENRYDWYKEIEKMDVEKVCMEKAKKIGKHLNTKFIDCSENYMDVALQLTEMEILPKRALIKNLITNVNIDIDENGNEIYVKYYGSEGKCTCKNEVLLQNMIEKYNGKEEIDEFYKTMFDLEVYKRKKKVRKCKKANKNVKNKKSSECKENKNVNNLSIQIPEWFPMIKDKPEVRSSGFMIPFSCQR